MSRFIKSKINNVAYNRNFISYIRILRKGDDYKIVIGYAPCNDAYKEIVIAENLDINSAEAMYDKYLAELEEEPMPGYLKDYVGSWE